jgi:hypothetical protein
MTETNYYKQIINHLENIVSRQSNIIAYYNQAPLVRLWKRHVNDFSVEIELSRAAEERAMVKQLESLRTEIVEYTGIKK